MQDTKTQHFFAPTMRQAMTLVKHALGPQAIIYAQHKVPGGVEIEAALEDANTINIREDNTQTTIASEKLQSNIQDLQSQMQSLHHLLYQRSQPNSTEHSQPSNAFEGLLQQLDFQADTIRKLTQRVGFCDDNQTSKQKLSKSLSEEMLCLGDTLLDQKGIVSLLGPTGVGKTTTIAKLAARFVLRYGSESLGLISTDCIRVAGREQLSIIANILNCSIMPANNQQQLVDALDALSNKRLILIDTAGLSPNDHLLKYNLEMLTASKDNIHSYLVLAANCHPHALQRSIQHFYSKMLKGCIITKIDESSSLGPILSTIISNHLGIAYLSQGQRVPEDLQLATINDIVELLMQQYQQCLTFKTQQREIGELAYAE